MKYLWLISGIFIMFIGAVLMAFNNNYFDGLVGLVLWICGIFMILQEEEI